MMSMMTKIHDEKEYDDDQFCNLVCDNDDDFTWSLTFRLLVLE